MPTQQDAAKAQEKKAAEEEARKGMLDSLLTPEAKERLANLKLVKADKVRQLENMMMSMAQQGRLRPPVTDNQLKEMLGQITGGSEKGSGGSITYDRRRYADEDEEIDLSDL